MEYAGTIRRGYFVRALSGEQYALPEALERLRAIRVQNASSEPPLASERSSDLANPFMAYYCRDAELRASPVISGRVALRTFRPRTSLRAGPPSVGIHLTTIFFATAGSPR